MAALKPSITFMIQFTCLFLVMAAAKIVAEPPLLKVPDVTEAPPVTEVVPTRTPCLHEIIDVLENNCLAKCDKKCKSMPDEKPQAPCLRVCLTCCLVSDGCVPFTISGSGYQNTCKIWGQVVIDDVVRLCP